MYGHAGEDRVVGARRGCLTLLKHDQAVVHILNGEKGCCWRDPADGGKGRGVRRRAHGHARQVVGPLHDESFGTKSRWLASKYTVENAMSSARAHVMVIALTTMSTFSFCSARMRSADVSSRYSTLSGVADQVPGDLADDIHVEPLQLPGRGIPKTQQVGVLIQADDQPAPPLYRLHSRAGFGGRLQARRGVATLDGRAGHERRTPTRISSHTTSSSSRRRWTAVAAR